MPQKAWSAKRERQYEHIKDGYEERGVSEDEAEERAARTVNKERREAGETKAQTAQRTADRDRHRLRAVQRGARPGRPRPERTRRRGGRLHVRPDLRPLPPLDRAAPAQPVRVDASSARSRRRPTGSRIGTGRHLPDDAHPPGDHRPRRGDDGGAHARPLLPRRRAPARTSTSTSSAHAWPEWDVRAEMLEEAVEVIRRAVARAR